jgi:hypothetical protein
VKASKEVEYDGQSLQTESPETDPKVPLIQGKQLDLPGKPW